MVELTSNAFAREVLQSDLPVLVDFWAPWCKPCMMLAPIVAELADAYQGKIKVVKVNMDNHPDLAGEYGVMSIPTVCFFVKGQEAFRTVGVKSKKDLANQIEQHLK